MNKPWPTVRLGELLPPPQLAADLFNNQQCIADMMRNIQKPLSKT